MKGLFLVLMVFLVGCERHQMSSSVSEDKHSHSFNLSLSENIMRFYAENDYKSLKQGIAQIDNIDAPIVGGKNLLYLSVEDSKYSLIDYLIESGASPDLILNVNRSDISAINLASSFSDESSREISLAILTGHIDRVSYSLFVNEINSTVNGDVFDLDWLRKIVMELDLDVISEREFAKIVVSKASKANNYSDYIDLIVEHLTETVISDWVDWSEKPFIDGRYRKAKCSFDRDCLSFDEFILSCSSKMRSKLTRAKSKISPFLKIRNGLNGCHINKFK